MFDTVFTVSDGRIAMINATKGRRVLEDRNPDANRALKLQGRGMQARRQGMRANDCSILAGEQVDGGKSIPQQLL